MLNAAARLSLTGQELHRLRGPSWLRRLTSRSSGPGSIKCQARWAAHPLRVRSVRAHSARQPAAQLNVRRLVPADATFLLLLALGLIGGLMGCRHAMRKAAIYGKLGRALVPLAFCIFGFVPAILIRAGIAPWSSYTVAAAILYFIVFSVVVTVAMNGAIARSSPNTSLERTRGR